MGRGRHDKVLLDPEQRQKLENISHNGYAPAKKILHANVLLMSDESEKAPTRWTDGEIADALGVHQNTVARIRKRFLQQGIEVALNRSPRLQPPVPAKIDGYTEAQIIAVCCSEPPPGRVHWSLKLLTKEVKDRGIITEISRETLRRTLTKNALRPWKKERFCIPERERARFVAQMEVILDVYSMEHTPDEPLICMDEAAIQLLGHVYEPNTQST